MAASPGSRFRRDVLDYLATQLTENGRELEGAITRLHATYQLTGERITCDAAETTIGDLIRSKEPKRVKIDDILRIVAKHYGVQRGDFFEPPQSVHRAPAPDRHVPCENAHVPLPPGDRAPFWR